ncbi:MAG: haloacid dehalogenase type II [Planctomycetota bacterium]
MSGAGSPSAASSRAAITFDCYGTLIDWDFGIATALSRIESLAGCDMQRLMADRDAFEREIQLGDYVPYGEVLARSVARAARAQDRVVSAAESERFAQSMAAWPPFADSAYALARLAKRFRLVVLSNVERAVLEASTRALGSPFDAWITAEDVRSYKPHPAHFEAAQRELGLDRASWLHVAASVYHDIAPARSLGIASTWVARGAPRPAGIGRSVPDLKTLADELVG